MPITTRRNPDRDLTTFKCDGELSFVEIVAVIERFFQGTIAPPTNKILWDIRTASIDNLTANNVVHIADLVNGFRAEAEDTKIAVVISNTFSPDVANKYKARSKEDIEYFIVFRKIDEAIKWLDKN